MRNITVATGGFLYTGEYVHSWLAATQYIAPLMANFDTSLTPDSNVRFEDNGTAFTVLWEKIRLQDLNYTGQFTFSATLQNSGHIIFNYFSIPIDVEKIKEDSHPVKIGLSDAYIIDKQIVCKCTHTQFTPVFMLMCFHTPPQNQSLVARPSTSTIASTSRAT